MKFYRLVSRCPANTPSSFIGYIVRIQVNENNKRDMIRLQFTTPLADAIFKDAWFYWDDLEPIE